MAGQDLKRSAPWAQPLRTLSAVRHICKLRGGTQSHLIRASDGNLYVTKFQNNPKHRRILASEFLATRLGLALGLPMPQVKVVEVVDWLIQQTPELHIEADDGFMPCGKGLQLGIKYAGDWRRDLIIEGAGTDALATTKVRQLFSQVLAFDKWVGNCDNRQAIFSKALAKRGEYSVCFIDQHSCFNGAEWTFPDQAYMGTCDNRKVYRDITGWKSFEPLLSCIADFDSADIWRIAVDVPAQWYESNTVGLYRLVESLDERRSIIPKLIGAFRASRSNPFPNWE